MTKFRVATAFIFFSASVLATAGFASAASRLSVLHSFTGPTADGAFPAAAVMRAADGNFYGTTNNGGASDLGTIFRMTPAGVITILHMFAGGAADGDSPLAALIQASDGNFYGTTYRGGAFGLGTAFRMTPAGGFTIIHSFGGSGDGANPRAALLQASDGNFYGTSEFGGTRNRGTLFGMFSTGTTAGAIFFRYSFTGEADGAYPYAPVIQARNGSLYGTVYGGDFSTFGRVFRLSGTTVTVVHTFLSGADGANPVSTVVEGTDGNFYGTTHFGGASNLGTAYKMTPAGVVTVLKSFSGGPEGANPHTTLVQPRDGNVYGTTKIGALGYGTLFKITPAGVFTVLHAFSGGLDGATPGPVIEAAGKLYGTSVNGGSLAKGNVFRFATTVGGATPGDFDGDGIADLSVLRPSNNRWFIVDSSTGVGGSRAWGVGGDLPVSGDFDGDGTIDFAVYRPSSGTWFILKSTTNYTTFDTIQFGITNDQPVPADYDGDGKTDVAVFRPSSGQWFVLRSSTGTGIIYDWGANGDIPAPGDFDGDGRADPAVFRPSSGVWFVLRSSTGTGITYNWGTAGDIPVPGDYDGDGRADVAIYRNGVWYIIKSSTNVGIAYSWGVGGDVPVPSDYDGDGRTDIAIYRPASGHWFILKSNTNFTAYDTAQWGTTGDVPILQR
jgi:uncharacterized repeat protein (TIGR03803 family)